jgi:hypothetical protein
LFGKFLADLFLADFCNFFFNLASLLLQSFDGSKITVIFLVQVVELELKHSLYLLSSYLCKMDLLNRNIKDTSVEAECSDTCFF